MWGAVQATSCPPRYHNVGLLVFFLHDITDVQLEFTKLNTYFKAAGGTYHRLHGLLADLGCLCFCVSWSVGGASRGGVGLCWEGMG